MRFNNKKRRWTHYAPGRDMNEQLMGWLDRVSAHGDNDVPEDETNRLLDDLFALMDDEEVLWQAFWWTKLPWWMIGERERQLKSHSYIGGDKYAKANPAFLSCGCKVTTRRQDDSFTDPKAYRYRFQCSGRCETAKHHRQEQELARQRAEEERLAKITPYERYLQSEEWQQLRQKVLTRDKRRCRRCGERNSLHVHHLHYENLYDEALEDLVTMCKDCHKEVHKFPELHPDWIRYDARPQRKKDPVPPPPKAPSFTFSFGSADVGLRKPDPAPGS